MQLTMRLTYSLKILISSFLILNSLGCQTLSELPPKTYSFREKIIYAPFEQVWRAAQLAMGKYTLATNNIDTGIIETEIINGNEGWKAPHEVKNPSPGVKYKLTLRLVKGKVDSKQSVRIIATKAIELHKDFFAEPETLSSDGLEELAILYRIEREVIIDNALKKAAKISHAE